MEPAGSGIRRHGGRTASPAIRACGLRAVGVSDETVDAERERHRDGPVDRVAAPVPIGVQPADRAPGLVALSSHL